MKPPAQLQASDDSRSMGDHIVPAQLALPVRRVAAGCGGCHLQLCQTIDKELPREEELDLAIGVVTE